ncbi:DUF389 domain-containing protein [Demequina sp.]|uniref:DUF389 domain-containing protein n=1 Tax=Demequina sp. TaxID=2050685 RepID=UPI003A8A6DB9
MTADRPTIPDSVRARARERAVALANPASLKGLVAAAGGALVLLMPDLATTAVSFVLVITVAMSGLLDLVFALRGRAREAGRRSRTWAFARGIVALAFAAFLTLVALFLPDGAQLGLDLVVQLVGLYVVIRGALVVVRALADRSTGHRGLRLTGGVTAIAVGVVANITPGTVTGAIISGAAIASLLFGLLLVTWGHRRVEGDLPVEVDPWNSSLVDVVWDWIKGSDIGNERRRDLAESLYFESPQRLSKRSAWWVMLVLSVAIATFAVLADSTAVVIGAMLVAPLMVPILGFAGAIVNGWRRRALDSAVMVALGVVASIALSYGLSGWAPVALAFDTNSQIVSRINPTVLDMLIAVAAGAAGAFATVDKRVSSSIAGVAIAVALVPPLSVVGVCLQSGRVGDAAGAFLLFLTNFVAIVLSAAVVFVLTGFVPPAVLRSRASGILTTVIPFVALAAVILVPLMFASEGLLTTAHAQTQAQSVVDDWLGEDSTMVVESLDVSADAVTVALIGTGAAPSAEDLQDLFDEALGRSIDVTVRVTPVRVTTVEAVPTPGA